MQEQRLFHTLEYLARECNATPCAGVTRFSWSDADRKAREWLTHELRTLGLEVRTDGIGNLRARLEGPLPAVLVGSHLDTVAHGGKLDGTYGVAAALEVMRTFHDEGLEPQHAVEFIAFAEEEGSNFRTTCLGSKYLTGQIHSDDLQKMHTSDGVCALEYLHAFGLQPERAAQDALRPQDVSVFLEIHIEQNAILEQRCAQIGIVTSISGMRLFQVCLTGRSDHAASPMAGRRDPAAGFAECAYRMEQLWKGGELPDDFSCTIGQMQCSPGVGIVIPEQVTFTIDIRHVDVSVLETGWEKIEKLLHSVAEGRGLFVRVERLSASGGARMSSDMGAQVRALAEARGLVCHSMPSGPAHDAAALSTVVPSCLLFVPSIHGVSHCPQEDTAPQDLIAGAMLLEDAVRLWAMQG